MISQGRREDRKESIDQGGREDGRGNGSAKKRKEGWERK